MVKTGRLLGMCGKKIVAGRWIKLSVYIYAANMARLGKRKI